MEVVSASHKPFVREALKRNQTRPKTLHRCRLGVTWPNVDGEVKRVVAMSDIHGATHDAVAKLFKLNLIDKATVVITTGDMGGENEKMGGLIDPTADYQVIRQACLAFYFVQGNHDVAVASHDDWRNMDGSPCYLDGRVIHSKALNTTMGGVSGIATDIEANFRPDSHIYSSSDYHSRLERVVQQNPNVLLTHQPPNKEQPYLAPVHLFGHKHVSDSDFIEIEQTSGHLKLNMDGRIIVWE